MLQDEGHWNRQVMLRWLVPFWILSSQANVGPAGGNQVAWDMMAALQLNNALPIPSQPNAWRNRA